VLVASALAVAGCGERSEPVGELEAGYPVTVRGGGDSETEVRARPERIVALDPGSAELLAALGVADRVVGVPAGTTEASFPDAEEVVRRTGQVAVDHVVRLDPDLIVAAAGVDTVELSRAERETGAAVYLQPATSVDEVERAALELGLLLGEAVRGRQLAAEIARETAAVEELVAGEPIVTVFVDTGFYITVPERSLLGDLIRRARGESVAGEAPGPDPFPPAELVELDPDVYVVTSESRTTLAQLRRNPTLRDLTAVREGRFVELPSELVMRAGPRAAEALRTVAGALHPDAAGA
jgi:iron complex transport system substrate-binding protein